MSKKCGQQQHGDVLINKIDALPVGLKPYKARGQRFILADGEVTGHAHAIPVAENVEMFEAEDGTLYLQVKEKEVEVTHEEHAKQDIAPGVYEIGQVVEADPFEDTINRVRD